MAPKMSRYLYVPAVIKSGYWLLDHPGELWVLVIECSPVGVSSIG